MAKSSKNGQDTFSTQDYIEVEGARSNNLQNISVKIPRNKLVVITGISGSGKSSLAFNTIYAEGQRRYLESFSGYARQFIGGLERPDVDKISGLSPVISIEQKSTSKNPRSTVGTVTEIYDFIRLLFARVGIAYSYETGKKMLKFSEEDIVQDILSRYTGNKSFILAPIVRGRKGHYRELFEQIRKQGYLKVRVDGDVLDIKSGMKLDRYKIHDIEVVVDRLIIEEKFTDRLRQSIAKAMKLGHGLLFLHDLESEKDYSYSMHLMDPEAGISYEDPSPNTFSFNSPYGACRKCNGIGLLSKIAKESIVPDDRKSIFEGGIAPLGQHRETGLFRELRKLARKYGFNLTDSIREIPIKAYNYILYGNEKGIEPEISDLLESKDDRWYTLNVGGVMGMLHNAYSQTSSDGIRRWAEDYMNRVTCDNCDGYRLRKESLHFKIAGKHIGEVSQLSIDKLADWFANLDQHLNERQRTIATELIKEIRVRINFLLEVGLDYLSIDRPARSLSGGESQRIRLATQIGSKLSGITYILDEPSIGLHQRDNQKLIEALKTLVKEDNSVIVVEHDKEIMLESDYLLDLGPGAGEHGGKVVAEGHPSEFGKFNSITSNYITEEVGIHVPEHRRKGNGRSIFLKGARGNNLKNVDLEIPLGKLLCVTGVSGSGKSSLINQTLYPVLSKHFYRSKKKWLEHDAVEGMDEIDKVLEIDQSPIGRTPRSNPATYIKVFDEIRALYASMPEAQIRGYKPGRFSFNVKGGRCEECSGGGMQLIEMNFLPNVYVQCPVCLGKRYNRETLEIRFKGKSIYDVLELTVEEAVEFFKNQPKINRKLTTLESVGLGYLRIGQSSTTISGGEAQRVKLSAELSKKDTGNTLYILDEPTTGLHFQDIRVLLDVLNKLVDKGNTVLVIEHNMDVIKVADYLIDVGPDSGAKGGEIVFAGTPEELSKTTLGHTAKFLKKELK